MEKAVLVTGGPCSYRLPSCTIGESGKEIMARLDKSKVIRYGLFEPLRVMVGDSH